MQKTFQSKIVSSGLFVYLYMDPKARYILEQVGKLYHRYGIKSVTMDDVAKQLGISKKTIYEFFSDKEDLVKQVLLFEHDHYCGFLNAIEDKQANAVEELFEVYKMMNAMLIEFNPSMEYDIRKYYPNLFLKIREIRRKRMYDSVYNNLNQGKKEGLYRKELNSKTIAKLHVSRTESLLDSDMFTQEELTSLDIFHEIFLYHLHGILSHKGRTFFENNFEKFKATLS
ncbi:MAG: TetR/AcrR family transcriptional regulator [Bacteroidales bacterium]|nr:TetR/AcrR family transcriptional regulator [Bacteroidales bacterium]